MQIERGKGRNEEGDVMYIRVEVELVKRREKPNWPGVSPEARTVHDISRRYVSEVEMTQPSRSSNINSDDEIFTKKPKHPSFAPCIAAILKEQHNIWRQNFYQETQVSFIRHTARDAVTREKGLRMHKGTYFLCDNGYANCEGFLTPYKNVRYHLKEWGVGTQRPQNALEPTSTWNQMRDDLANSMWNNQASVDVNGRK
ncbi:hypothetical protein AAHA92_21467 [Salvia divinorum]|uniref:DDE Tnp4 domain-containing protein n=1 Tax=Salvia divinorum TaxID=28513 RepID=A0ABD1GKJ5_SALDI